MRNLTKQKTAQGRKTLVVIYLDMTLIYIIALLIGIVFTYFALKTNAKEKLRQAEIKQNLEDETLSSDKVHQEDINKITKNSYRDLSFEEQELAMTENSLEFIEYVKTYGGQRFRWTVNEEEDLLNTSLWKYFTSISILGVFKMTETRIITILETTDVISSEPISKKGDRILYNSESVSHATLTIKASGKELNEIDKVLYEKLKANPKIEFAKKGKYYHFKFKSHTEKTDLDLLLGR